MSTVIETIAEAVRKDLVAEEVRGVRVLDVEVAPSTNPDAPESVVVRLTLSDPSPEGTWDLQAADAIRDRAQAAITASGADASSVAMVLVPEHPDFGDE